MLSTWITIAILAVVVFILFTRMSSAKGVRQITTSDLEKEVKENKNAQFIDVRTPGEYKSGHIRQFKNLPLQQLQAKASQLSKDKEVIVICQSGNRSNAASGMLKKMGYTSVTNVRGGMNAWRGPRVN